jgi:hypothetical protein
MELKLGKAAQLWTTEDIAKYNLIRFALNAALNDDKTQFEQADHLIEAGRAILDLAQSVNDAIGRTL